MAMNTEKKILAGATTTTTNPYGRVNEELFSVAAREHRRRKRGKCLVYIGAFAVFQTVVILIFALTVLRVKSPKFRVRSATFENFQVSNASSSFDFDIRMNAELGVKNTNFGHYKYRNATVEFFYKEIYKVGEAYVYRGRAKARKTRKFNVVVNLSSGNVPSQELGNEFGRPHALISLTSRSTLRGKVEIMKVMKKKKSSNMNCVMNINISTQQLQDLRCR